MVNSRRPSTAPGPARDTGTSMATAKSNRGSFNGFWSFSLTKDKRRASTVTGPPNTIAQTRASSTTGPISVPSSSQLSFSDEPDGLCTTPINHSTKSRRSSFFRPSGYTSDDNTGNGRSILYRQSPDPHNVHRSPPRLGKTQLQSTPEEAPEVSGLSLLPVPERENRLAGNLQSRPSRSRSNSTLSRPPPPPSSYAVYTPPILLSSTAHSASSSPILSNFSRHGVSGPTSKPPRPDRNPARLPQRKTSTKRPSTASGVLEGSFMHEMMQPLAAPYLHPVKTAQSSLKLKKSETIDGFEKPQFSTADRTILAELRENLSARNSQFTMKNGKKYHPYSAMEVPFPRNYERIVLDHEMWETLFYQQFTKDVTFHHFETPPSKALDIGCGSGAWILNASRVWKQTHFVGLDIVPLHPDLTRVGSTDLANRISWVQANFLEGLPFPNEEFDFVMVKRIARGVPEDKWDALLEEIVRVMKPGAAIEVVEEDLYFPGSMSDPLILAAGSTITNASTSNLSTASTTSHDSIASFTTPSLAQSSPPPVAPVPRTKRSNDTTDQFHKRTEKGDVGVGAIQAEKLRSSVSASELWRNRSKGGGGYDELGMEALSSTRGVTESVELGSDRGGRIARVAAFHARSASRDHFNLTTSTTSSRLLEVPAQPPQRPKTAQPLASPRSPGRKRGMSASRVGAPIAGILPSPPLPLQLQPQNSGQNSTAEQSHVNTRSHTDGVTVSPEPPTPEHRSLSLFRTPTKSKKAEKEDESIEHSSREGPAQQEIPRLLYKPSSRPPFNPRDHSLLERIYREMHEARFINLTPLALLAAQLGLYFKHVKTHAPISFAFPPKPRKRYVLEQARHPGAHPWSDDEDDHDDPLFPHISDHGHDEATSPEQPELVRRASKRALDKIEDVAPQYIVVDNARLPASTPRVAKSRTFTELAHSNTSTETITASSPKRSTKSFRSFAVTVSPDRSQPDSQSPTETRNQTRTQVDVPSLPGKALEIDLRSLHMHLSTRVSETLGCAEAMWEWVVAEQQRHAAGRASETGRSRSLSNDTEASTDPQMKTIRGMTRADFDACLSRFEMDMHDNIALDYALEHYLNWKPSLPQTRTAERKSFETACALWDTQQAAQLADADGDSERSSATCVDQPQPRFSRTFRIFAAWKDVV